MQEREGDKSPKLVPFPVCLAVKYGNEITAECPDFILNIDESWVFVRTDAPLPEGASLLMHFYIPPESKLLAEIKGIVLPITRHDIPYPKGMLIKFTSFSRKALKSLENYVEEKKHLIDKKA